TAFNRLHRQTNEGGSIEEEFRNEYVADRVHTFGTAFLGLTFECARCHDHKFDPIKQRDYYSLSAFFNNIDESGLYAHFTRATPSPTLLLYRDGEKGKHANAKKLILEKEQAVAKIAASVKPQFVTWLKSAPTNFSPTPNARFSFEQLADNKTPDVTGKLFAGLSESPEQTDGRFGKALKFNGESSVGISGVADFRRTDPFSFSLWIKPTEKQDRAVVFHHSRSWTDSGSRGYELLLEKGRPVFALIHFWPGNAIAVRAPGTLPLNEWTHLTIAYDGSSRAEGIKMFQNGELARVEVVRDHLFKDISHRSEWGDSDVGGIDLRLAARFRDSGFKNGSIDEFQIFDRALAPIEAMSLFNNSASVSSSPNKENDLFAYYLNRVDKNYQLATTELKKLRDAENNLVNDIPEIMVMQEMSKRRPTFVLKRGAYDAPGDSVEPGTPESIFPFAKGLPRNRLGLASWMIDARNPLTARVVVNRIWKMHFGKGLVGTPENFGSQGELPSHLELLDWLSEHFIESGWNVKALHKLVLTSATYRQSSVGTTEAVAADPDNRWLGRGAKHRLQAEQIRDAALAVSGLLSPKIGGPSVKPYQPAGLWEQAGLAKTYDQDKGEKLYRRSLYTFWRRTSPPPSMTTFDATSREVCTARRETTATPLQSLILLNDPQFIEAARVLAERMLREHAGDSTACMKETFRVVLGRQPQEQEQKILGDMYQEQLQLFADNSIAAEKYLSVGEHSRDAKLPVAELAALTVLANTLMNHDEFVMER
ncbi:MAG: Planctomycete cytochrome, partial [Verrucomicrobiales bacterium]|nr:Planctomycete cytochrome [Verrucomicrobiales bacterium]